ncbi:MAG: hypothetical protein OXC48_07260 [Endozoicomonadaceae bacterium]|nr:hypothetical protein [Endozoicomonadaceae bacterium]
MSKPGGQKQPDLDKLSPGSASGGDGMFRQKRTGDEPARVKVRT